MKKKLLVLFVILVALMLFTSTVFADDIYVDGVPKDSHKIRNKWDLSGVYVAHPGYNWGGLAEGATWTYKIHIKEAMYGEYSKGTVHFMTDGIDVVGNVTATKRNYMWADIAAVGSAEYNDHIYYFMFFYVDYATWFVLSDTPYDAAWAAETTLAPRLYQTHSLNPGTSLPFDYKEIHTD